MKRKTLLNKTVKQLQKLPDHKLKEVADFTEYLSHKVQEKELIEGIESLASESGSFDFLKDEEELYSLNDLKEKY